MKIEVNLLAGHMVPLRRMSAGALLAFFGCLAAVQPAAALSEIQREEVPIPDDADPGPDEIRREQLPPPGAEEPPPEPEPEPDAPVTAPSGDVTVPLPDPITIPKNPPAAQPPADGTDALGEPAEPVPDILYDVELLPEPVRRMRGLIMEACLSGDVEQLRPLISIGQDPTQLSFGGIPGDPIEFLRELSGDEEGQEILAILYEVLEAGFVLLADDQAGEMYVWPYFFAVPLDMLDSRQRVELFRIVTAGDYEDMKNYGAYIFYRVGISPEGRWLFFVAGD